jgi:predicted nucleic-acid-binding Zn-ribbon protein
VPFGWFQGNYERTCRDCGYSWQVPRSIARRGIHGISFVTAAGAAREQGLMQPGGTGLSEIESGIAARAEEMESYRICAKCGVDDFTQRPVRGR